MRTFLALFLLLLLTGVTALISAQSGSKELTYTRRDIRRKMRDAKTPQDFQELAQYYDSQAKRFRSSAEQQKHESSYYQNHDGGKQYPLSPERARLLREYYERRMKESEVLADKYRKEADSVRAEQSPAIPLANAAQSKP